MNKAAAFFFILLISLAYAGELWKIDTGSAVREQPLELGIRVIAATEGGKVYSIEPPAVKWSYNVGSPVISGPVIFGDKILVATETKIVALNQYGALQWETTLPGITSFAASDKIYVADQNGIQALSQNGSLVWNFAPGSEDLAPSSGSSSSASASKVTTDQFCTRPYASSTQVFFGNRDYIYSISTSGAFQWKNQIGHMWSTPPSYDAGTFTIYSGTAEGVLYALESQSGKVRFSQNVHSQISTTPLLFEGNVLVGTSDNMLYGVSGLGIQWSAELDGKVNRALKAAVSPSGTSTLYLTTTKSVYAVDPRNGEILFKRPFLDWPSSPNYIGGSLIVGTADGKIYGLDPNKGCSITDPAQDAQIGDNAATLYGISYSNSGAPVTDLRFNGGPWIPINGTSWEYNLDPSIYPYGVLEVECRASDGTGPENEPYSKTTLIHIQGAEPFLMSIVYPDVVKANTNFSIGFLDSRGLPLAGVKAKAGTKTFTSKANGNMTLSLPEGAQQITFEKSGYQTEKITISAKGEPTLGYILGFLFVAGLLAYIYFAFLRSGKKELVIREKH
jgi:hypothetical protein